jgi:hypothetical protein
VRATRGAFDLSVLLDGARAREPVGLANSDGRTDYPICSAIEFMNPTRSFPPLGRLLKPGRPLALFEEELPRSGLLATRAWQFARTASGASVAWIGRRTRPGRGESRSGLGYDRLAPPG